MASRLASQLGIPHATEDIAETLAAAGCYARRDEAIRRVVPSYGEGWKCKLVLPGAGPNSDKLNVTSLVVQDPTGQQSRVRLGASEYRQIVAATNFKQRVRKMMEYYHADRLHYAVIGTPNRLEYDQGFFVKGGDGLADVKPIAHLYKTEVYALAAHLGVPREVTDRPPTTDTFSLPQSQEEFYFSFPARILDQILLALNEGRPAEVVSREAPEFPRRRLSGPGATSLRSGRPRATSTLPRCWSSRFPCPSHPRHTPSVRDRRSRAA